MQCEVRLVWLWLKRLFVDEKCVAMMQAMSCPRDYEETQVSFRV